MLLVLYMEYRVALAQYQGLTPMDYSQWLKVMYLRAQYSGHSLSQVYAHDAPQF